MKLKADKFFSGAFSPDVFRLLFFVCSFFRKRLIAHGDACSSFGRLAHAFLLSLSVGGVDYERAAG
jgi:hypothetical protein